MMNKKLPFKTLTACDLRLKGIMFNSIKMSGLKHLKEYAIQIGILDIGNYSKPRFFFKTVPQKIIYSRHNLNKMRLAVVEKTGIFHRVNSRSTEITNSIKGLVNRKTKRYTSNERLKLKLHNV